MRASSSRSAAVGVAQGKLGAGVCVQSCSRGRQSLVCIICPESVCVRLETERDMPESGVTSISVAWPSAAGWLGW